MTPKEINKIAARINYEVNKTIRYEADVINCWSHPNTTLARGYGDCEDIAMLKAQQLVEAGVPENTVRIALTRGEYPGHAVCLLLTSRKRHLLSRTWIPITLVLDNATPHIYALHETRRQFPTVLAYKDARSICEKEDPQT